MHTVIGVVVTQLDHTTGPCRVVMPLQCALNACMVCIAQMCEWCRVDELQQQEAAIRVAMDVASTEKHKVSLCAMSGLAMCCN